MSRSQARGRPSALVVIDGDDVYEDLFTASLKLSSILIAAGFATRTAMGTARLADRAAAGGPGQSDAAAGGPGQSDAAAGGPGQSDAAMDLFVLYTALGNFPPDRQKALSDAVRAGSGLLAVHASNVFPARGYQTARDLVGSRYVSHGPEPHQSRFRVETDQRHPVTRDLAPFDITHEHYQIETAADAQVVAWREGGEPVMYVRQEGLGRVCYLQLGHDMRCWDEPPVRALVANAARWAGGEDTR